MRLGVGKIVIACAVIARHTPLMPDLTQHLIDRVLPAAYTPRPGQPAPRYSEQQARQVLAFLARQMNQDNTRDLAWWQISRWAPPGRASWSACSQAGFWARSWAG